METDSLENFVNDIKCLKEFNETFKVIEAANKQINDLNQECAKWEFVKTDKEDRTIVKNSYQISLSQRPVKELSQHYYDKCEFEVGYMVSHKKQDDPVFREFFLKSLNKNMGRIIEDMYTMMKEKTITYEKWIKDDTKEIMDDLKDEI